MSSWRTDMASKLAKMNPKEQMEHCKAMHLSLSRELVQAGLQTHFAHTGAFCAAVEMLAVHAGLEKAAEVLFEAAEDIAAEGAGDEPSLEHPADTTRH